MHSNADANFFRFRIISIVLEHGTVISRIICYEPYAFEMASLKDSFIFSSLFDLGVYTYPFGRRV